jgi:purine-nucleoside phosphorylase
MDSPRFLISRNLWKAFGQLILGEISGKKLVVMAGRFHFYEGYSAEQVIFPIRVMKGLGINSLFISNAAGGVNPAFKVGDLMVIKDHISFAIANPLIGPNESALGPRFPDMSEPYSKVLIEKAQVLAKQMGIPLQHGVYFGVMGPTFETRAEYKLIRILGWDAVGIATVQEVIAAVHLGLPFL